MKELSFYFFQCVNHRILAKSTRIEMYIVEDKPVNKLELIIKDNGLKFDKLLMNNDDTYLKKTEPALYFLKSNCKQIGGDFNMLSHNLSGNMISFTYPLKNKSRLPFGNGAAFLSTLFVSNPQIHFIYSQISQNGEFVFDSLQFINSFGAVDFEDKEFLFNLKQLIEVESTAIQEFA